MENSFSDLYSSLNKPLYFDFYLPDHNILIEYDGMQHFKPINYFGGVKTYRRIKTNDLLKNQYALSNNYFLLRIPYTYSSYEDLQNIVSDFISTPKKQLFLCSN